MGTKIVQDSSLTSVANAIRTKGGTSSPLEFPDEFISAIGNIQTGTTPTGTKSININTNGTRTEDVTNYASAEITTNIPQMKRSILRPDAVLVESWNYDKLWIADEGQTLPEYSTTLQTLKASEQLTITHEWDLDNYKYFLMIRCLVIPIYSTDRIARGRQEWSETNVAYELVYPSANSIRALIDPSKVSVSNALGWVTSGGIFYRLPYFTNTLGQLSVYSNTAYGIWCAAVGPAYASGEISVNSPTFQLRCQANILDQPFYEELTDIRFQYVIELWREPVGSLDYDGWIATQEFNKILECVYSPTQKLT